MLKSLNFAAVDFDRGFVVHIYKRNPGNTEQ